MKPREVDLGRVARAWLANRYEARRVTIHQEVETPHGRPDLVARGQAGFVAVVECKVTLGLPVIAQAHRWLAHASESWVCVPAPRRRVPSLERVLGRAVCAQLGLGLVEVNGLIASEIAVPVRRDPKGLAAFWDRYWHPDQESRAEAGTNRGGYSTPWRRTAEALVAYVAEHPGVTLKEALKALPELHYRRLNSAVGTTSRLLLTEGPRRPAALAGIRIEGKGSKARLWPVTEDTF